MTDDARVSPAGVNVSLRPGRPALLEPPALSDNRSARNWLIDQREAVRAELRRHGSLLIRGLPIVTAEDFAEMRDVLVNQRATYKEKATPRSAYGHEVFSSTDLPALQPIAPHNENSYTLEFPGLLLFCCLQAPTSGGATTVCDVRAVLRALPDDLVGRFRENGWLLIRHYHENLGLPWQTTFGTDRRDVVESYCLSNLIGFSWEGEVLRTTQRRPAIVRHPATGEEVWFNHAVFWSRWSLDEEVREVLEMTFGDALPFATAFGDGLPLDEEQVRIINAAYQSAICRDAWQVGDLLLVDNLLTAHGRDAFVGERRIVVAMGDPVQVNDCQPIPPPTPYPVA